MHLAYNAPVCVHWPADQLLTFQASESNIRVQLLKRYGERARVDILDRLPTPFGLVRSGVAPDHPDTKVPCPGLPWLPCLLDLFGLVTSSRAGSTQQTRVPEVEADKVRALEGPQVAALIC